MKITWNDLDMMKIWLAKGERRLRADGRQLSCQRGDLMFLLVVGLMNYFRHLLSFASTSFNNCSI
jgi:hypothetical protein